MKNNTRFLIACILIVVIVISSIIVTVTEREPSRGGGPAVLKDPVTVTLSMEVDPGGLAGAVGSVSDGMSGTADLMTSLVDLANNMTVVAVVDGNDIQLDVLLKDENLVQAALRNTGNEISLVSDMLPDNSVLVLAAGEIIPGAGEKELDIRVTTDDIRMLRSAVKACLVRMSEEVASRTGDNEEKGSWTFESREFTARRSIGLSAKDAALILYRALQDLARDEKVSALLARLGVDEESLGLDAAIADIESRPAGSFPALTAYQYRSGGDTYTEMILAGDGVSAVLRYGSVGTDTVIRFSSPRYGSVDLVADSLGYAYDLSAAFSAGRDGIVYTVLAKGTTEQNGERAGTVSLGTGETQFATLRYTVRKGGSVTASFDRDGRQVLTSQDLSGDTFSLQMQSKVMGLLTRISSVMPEAASGLMQAFFGIFR